MRQSAIALHTRDNKIRLMSAVACFALVTFIMLVPAVWNGYPLIYFDSQDYVNMSFTFDLIPWRTMPYGLVVAIARFFDTLFAVVVAQALLLSWVLYETVTAFVLRGETVIYLGLALLLVGMTGLPWITSQILADALTGVFPLGIAILAFGKIPLWRRVVLVPLIAIAIGSHMSHVAVAAGLLIALLGLRVVACYRPGPRPRLGATVVAIVLGIAVVPAVHAGATGEVFFSRSGRVLQLALFIQDGIAQRYLNVVCPQGAAYRLCAYRQDLPPTADAFLWWHNVSPIDELGGWVALKDEAEEIVDGAIQMFPTAVALAAARNFVLQLQMIALGDGLEPKTRGDYFGEFGDTAKNRYPSEYPAFAAARQQQGDGIDFSALNSLQVPIAIVAQLALPIFLLIAWYLRDRRGAGLVLIVILGLIGNAFVCGAISNPHDRYQNRIVWIAVLTVAMLPLRWYQLATATDDVSVNKSPI